MSYTNASKKRRTSYVPIVLINFAAFPLSAIIAINAAHEVIENAGFRDGRYWQDGTNLRIAYLLFILLAVPFVITSIVVQLKMKQLTRATAWLAGFLALTVPPLVVFILLISTGTDLG